MTRNFIGKVGDTEELGRSNMQMQRVGEREGV